MTDHSDQNSTRRPRILIVANKRLPENDYRINYRHHTRLAEIVYGLPAQPCNLHSHEFIECGFTEGIGTRDLLNFCKLFAHLRRFRKNYRLVHFFSTKLVLFGPLCAALAGIPSVSTITGFGRTFNRSQLRYRLLRPIYLVLLRFSLRLSRAAFFQNYGDMEWLAEKLPTMADKMSWVGSAVAEDVVKHKDFEQRPLVVLMVARLMPDKGVPLFLEAARRLRDQSIQFRLVGPPSAGEGAMHQQVLQADKEGIIEYLGELEHSDLILQYSQSHVFAFPSKGEGMPRVMLEAGHALLCPLASDIPAHRDLVEQGRGLLIESDAELESFVTRLSDLNSNRVSLARNALNYQRHIVNKYGMKGYARRMDDRLQAIVSLDPLHGKSKRTA